MSLISIAVVKYRVSEKKLTPFIFKLASNLLLEFDNIIPMSAANRTWVIHAN